MNLIKIKFSLQFYKIRYFDESLKKYGYQVKRQSCWLLRIYSVTIIIGFCLYTYSSSLEVNERVVIKHQIKFIGDLFLYIYVFYGALHFAYQANLIQQRFQILNYQLAREIIWCSGEFFSNENPVTIYKMKFYHNLLYEISLEFNNFYSYTWFVIIFVASFFIAGLHFGMHMYPNNNYPLAIIISLLLVFLIILILFCVIFHQTSYEVCVKK